MEENADETSLPHLIYLLHKSGKTSAPIESMEVKFPPIIENYDKQTDRPTDRPTDGHTSAYWEVSLPINGKPICIYVSFSTSRNVYRSNAKKLNLQTSNCFL